MDIRTRENEVVLEHKSEVVGYLLGCDLGSSSRPMVAPIYEMGSTTPIETYSPFIRDYNFRADRLFIETKFLRRLGLIDVDFDIYMKKHDISFLMCQFTKYNTNSYSTYDYLDILPGFESFTEVEGIALFWSKDGEVMDLELL